MKLQELIYNNGKLLPSVLEKDIIQSYARGRRVFVTMLPRNPKPEDIEKHENILKIKHTYEILCHLYEHYLRGHLDYDSVDLLYEVNVLYKVQYENKTIHPIDEVRLNHLITEWVKYKEQ